MTSRDQLQETLYNRLFWHIAERDDARIADHSLFVPFFQIVLVFLMKVVGFIKTIDEIRDLLSTDELFMSMCGFNAHQVKNGSCGQGTKLRKTPLPEIRGSLCVDTVPTILSPLRPYGLKISLTAVFSN